MSGTSAQDYLAQCAIEERSGDWLGAHDVATRGLAEHPEDLALRHRAVLALARSGATASAAERFVALGLDRHDDEDIAALGARIAKDLAFAAPAAGRAALARAAAEQYRGVHAATGGYYPAVNAATMFLLAGDALDADILARAALDACAQGPRDVYWIAATEIEARLVLGDTDGAAARLSKTRALAGDDHGALGTTLRQLELVCAARGVDPAVLAPLRPPVVAYLAGDADPAAIAGLLDGVGYGFSGLATDTELAFAEAVIARGAELHLVLPVSADRTSARLGRCLAAARSVRVIGDGAPDAVLVRHAGRVAAGLARLRARFLHTDVRAIGQPAAEAPLAASPRSVRALLFGDVKGYSKLAEAQVPVFVSKVMGELGGVLDAQGDDVLLRNSWGDGLYVVLANAAAAARCALALQTAMRGLDLGKLALPPHCSLRVAAHLGPVHHCYDAVSRSDVFCGTHVTQAARIEPITPEGEVYVTEAFAAVLALEDDAFACDYVGDVPTAKGYGSLRMHLLRRVIT